MSANAVGILIATSIPPRLARYELGENVGEAYQSLCLQSWQECGFRILSVNHPSEIPDLAARFPAVEFFATEKNAAAITGRKNPFLGDLLLALANTPETTVGIANSDILFQPTAAWHGVKSLIAAGAVVTGQRYDTRSLAYGALARYIVGFDYFLFQREAAVSLIAEGQDFAMGLPWWDYWLPLALAFRGQRILHLERPVTMHLAHDASDAYGAHSAPWRALALAFVRALATAPDTASRLPEALESIRALSAELARAPEAPEDSQIDQRLIDLAGMAVRTIWSEPIEIDDAKFETDAAVGTLFLNFHDRVTAGTALREASEHEERGQLREAEPLFQTALAKAPDDPGVLYACANFLGRTGRVSHSADLLRKATGRAPRIATLWSSLGLALIELNRVDEGLENLREAIEIEPRSGAAYYDLARALAHLRRPAEEIRHVRLALLAVPDFPDAQEWAEYIARDFIDTRPP